MDIAQLFGRGQRGRQVEDRAQHCSRTHGDTGAADVEQYREPALVTRHVQTVSGNVSRIAIIDFAGRGHCFNLGSFSSIGRI